MASVAHLDDRVHLNKFDMYTWTDTFGVNTDGFPKDMYLDGSYTTQMDETPTQYPSIIDSEDIDHFNPQRLNMSGPMYLKECSVNPAPENMYPARKFEYDTGRVTWDRPGRPRMTRVTDDRNDKLFIILIAIVILLFLFRSKLRPLLKR
jgi:hypothetical protein